MAFFWGRFNPIETVDPEVKELYRIRDNDEIFKNNKALLVDTTSLYNNNVDNFKNMAFRMSYRPSDPIWLGMTEEERIENGLPTRAELIQNSNYGFIAFLGCGSKNIFNVSYFYLTIFKNLLSRRNYSQKPKKRRSVWISCVNIF